MDTMNQNTINAKGWGYKCECDDPIGRPVEGELIIPDDSYDSLKIKTKDGELYRIGKMSVLYMGMIEMQKLDGTWTRNYDEFFKERLDAKLLHNI